MSLHSKEDVFPEMKLRGLVTNFVHSCFCERFMYFQDRPAILLQQNRCIFSIIWI